MAERCLRKKRRVNYKELTRRPLPRAKRSRPGEETTFIAPDLPSQADDVAEMIEDPSWMVSLRKHHQALRTGIRLANVLPALRPLLTDVEYSCIEDERGNISRIDELIRILLTKEYATFDGFCSVLEENRYSHWASKLKGETQDILSSTGEASTGKLAYTSRVKGKAVASAKSVSQHSDRIRGWLSKLRSDCPQLQLLVIGETGTGKSALINNLVGENVTKVGRKLISCTSEIMGYEGVIEGVPVKLYDTPGLSDSRSDRDEEYLGNIRRLMEKETIHLIIYCFRMTEIRMRQSMTRTLQQFTEIGVDWKKAVIALTYADSLIPPSELKKKKGANISFFQERLAEWREVISETLAAETNLEMAEAEWITIKPTTGDSNEKLPNGEEWYIPFWLDVLDVLPHAARMRFIEIHKGNIKYGDRETRKVPKLPKDFILPPPPKPEESDPPSYKPTMGPTRPAPLPVASHSAAEQPSVIKVSVSNKAPVTVNHSPTTGTNKGTMRKPLIVLEGKSRERFENSIGDALGAQLRAYFATLGEVAAGAVATPFVLAGAAVAALGANVAKLFGWW